jgi:Caspase domain
MRKALVVGVNYYTGKNSCLYGCVNDAHSVKNALERNGDGTVNFSVKILCATGPNEIITRSELKDHIRQLFSGDSEIALLYFAGHGHIEATGGYILSSDAQGDDGVPISDILTLANQSSAKNRIIVLDSCHAGIAGVTISNPSSSELKEGTTILTASTAEQYASEESGAGVFTTLFVDGLNGAAGNLVGDVTPGSVYAHIDQSLGPWDQRPVFKTNVKSFVFLRKVQPAISLLELRRITEFFSSAGSEFALNPSFEPERSSNDPVHCPPDPINTAKFVVLQKYNRVNLVIPVNAPHMWHAAMESKSCKLTVLGEHYRRLIQSGRI